MLKKANQIKTCKNRDCRAQFWPDRFLLNGRFCKKCTLERKALRRKTRKKAGKVKPSKFSTRRVRKDVEATEAREFKDDRSYVTVDGRDILYGDDWDERKRELWVRAKGHCEYSHNGVMCFGAASHPHHRIKRSTKRDDRLENLQYLCPEHHKMMHPEHKPHWTERVNRIES